MDEKRSLKVLIVIDNLNTGGIATSLYNFLHYAHERMDIDLLVFDWESIDFSKVPNDVHVIKGDSRLSILGVSQKVLFCRSPYLASKRFFYVLISRMVSGELARRILLQKVNKLKTYDLAISYAHDNAWKSLSKGCIDYVVKNVVARRKATFIHCDYSNFGGYHPKQEKMLAKLDDIICVSDSCKNHFTSKFPNLKAKCRVIENFTNVDDIVAKAYAYDTEFKNEQYFVSVCRLSEEKGLSRTIRIWGRLNSINPGYKWVIVGDGPERKKIEASIKFNHLENIVFLVGNKANPYPYIKDAKLFMLVSLHEAAPMVYGESAALGIPIFTTETSSAQELVECRKWGIVVPNNELGIREGLFSILNNGKIPALKPQLDSVNSDAIQQLTEYISDCYGGYHDFKKKY